MSPLALTRNAPTCLRHAAQPRSSSCACLAFREATLGKVSSIKAHMKHVHSVLQQNLGARAIPKAAPPCSLVLSVFSHLPFCRTHHRTLCLEDSGGQQGTCVNHALKTSSLGPRREAASSSLLTILQLLSRNLPFRFQFPF